MQLSQDYVLTLYLKFEWSRKHWSNGPVKRFNLSSVRVIESFYEKILVKVKGKSNIIIYYWIGIMLYFGIYLFYYYFLYFFYYIKSIWLYLLGKETMESQEKDHVADGNAHWCTSWYRFGSRCRPARYDDRYSNLCWQKGKHAISYFWLHRLVPVFFYLHTRSKRRTYHQISRYQPVVVVILLCLPKLAHGNFRT